MLFPISRGRAEIFLGSEEFPASKPCMAWPMRNNERHERVRIQPDKSQHETTQDDPRVALLMGDVSCYLATILNCLGVVTVELSLISRF